MFKSKARTAIEKIVSHWGYRLIADNLFNWPERDQEFMGIYQKQAHFGWQGTNGPKFQRMYMVRNLLLSVKGLPGDWAECGVFKGSTAMLMAEYHRRHQLLQKGAVIHLFDSFEGLSSPGEADSGTKMLQGDYLGSELEVQGNLSEYEMFEYHRGWIPKRFPDVSDKRFSFVHIDVDLYEPVRDSLAFFLPRMVDGGIVVLDDYGCIDTPGALRATDEKAREFGMSVAALPYGQAFILAQGTRAEDIARAS